jgi:hypothetical protein
MISARGKSIFSFGSEAGPHSLGTRLPAASDISESSHPSRALFAGANAPPSRITIEDRRIVYDLGLDRARECVPLGGRSGHS